jgi:hypothetical protein
VGTFLRKYGVKLAVSLVIAAAFAWTLERGGLPLFPGRDALAKVSVVSCAEYVIMFMGWHTIRAARWRHLLAPIADVPLRRIIAVSWLGFAAILVMPFRAGEFVRPYLIRQKGKVSMAAALGTIGAERIIDGLYLTLLLGLCLRLSTPLDPLPDHIGKLQIPVAAVPFYAYLSLLGFTSAFVLMGLFWWRPKLGRTIVEKTLGLALPKAARKIADFVDHAVEGLKFLPNWQRFGPYLLETTLYWVGNGFGMWVLARGCGIESISLVEAVVVLGVLGVGTVVPAGPGLFGAFQASTYAALAMYFHDDVVLGPGVTFVFVLYVIQMIWVLVTAGLSLLLVRGAARELLEAEAA